MALFFVFEISMTVTEQLGTLERILTQGTITTLFQPIVSLSSQRILGYEALSRGPPTALCTRPSIFSLPRVTPGACMIWK